MVSLIFFCDNSSGSIVHRKDSTIVAVLFKYHRFLPKEIKEMVAMQRPLASRCPHLITRVEMGVLMTVYAYQESESNKFDDDVSSVDIHAYTAKHAKKLNIHF